MTAITLFSFSINNRKADLRTGTVLLLRILIFLSNNVILIVLAKIHALGEYKGPWKVFERKSKNARYSQKD